MFISIRAVWLREDNKQQQMLGWEAVWVEERVSPLHNGR
jgi:hypothetical protein